MEINEMAYYVDLTPSPSPKERVAGTRTSADGVLFQLSSIYGISKAFDSVIN
jgi:hypothetical protein